MAITATILSRVTLFESRYSWLTCLKEPTNESIQLGNSILYDESFRTDYI